MSDVLIPTWNLGDRLAKAREAAGIHTAADMARRMGVTDRTIRNWESGVTEPKPYALRAWSQITGVPMWWLLDEPDDGEPTDPTVNGGYLTIPWLIPHARAA